MSANLLANQPSALSRLLARSDTSLHGAFINLSSNLNEEQMEAFVHEHDESGPLLVLAGAGSGKTSVLTRRVARLIISGIPPEKILAVTFTQAAAEEMRLRVIDILSRTYYGYSRDEVHGFAGFIDSGWEAAASWLKQVERLLWLRTFHSAALQMLRASINDVPNSVRLGYPEKFEIVEGGLYWKLLREASEAELKRVVDSKTLKEFTERIDMAKNSMKTPDEMAVEATDMEGKLAARVLARLSAEMKRLGVMDMNDLIGNAVLLLENHQDVREYYQSHFQHILIDEYQDTNAAQYRFFRQLVGTRKEIFVVGDDDQSIYGWRGAEISNILNFRRDFPAAREIRFLRNYRSSETIINFANDIWKDKDKQFRKTLLSDRIGGEPKIKLYRGPDEAGEAAFIAREIRELIERGYITSPSECAILCRSNFQMQILTDTLVASGLATERVGTRRFWKLPQIMAARGAMTIIAAGLGAPISPTVLDNALSSVLAARAFNKPGIKVVNAGAALMSGNPAPFRAAVGDSILADQVVNVLQTAALAVNAAADMIAAVDVIFRAIGYIPESEVATQEEFADVRPVDFLRDLIGQMSLDAANHRGMELLAIENQFLLKSQDQQDETAGVKDAVRIMTIHSAKGLEWPVVFVAGCEEGVLPLSSWKTEELSSSQRQFMLEEEKRLFYVAVTRSRDRLYLTLAAKRQKGKELVETSPSRYLKYLSSKIKEIPGKKEIPTDTLWGKLHNTYDKMMSDL